MSDDEQADDPEIRTDGGHTPLRKLDHTLQDALYALTNFEGTANQSHVEAYLGRETRTPRANGRGALRHLIERDLVKPSGDHKAQFSLTPAGKAIVRQDAMRRLSVAEKLDNDVDVTEPGQAGRRAGGIGMTTEVMQLSEYAELIGNLADAWDGEEPVVLIGDRHGEVEVRAKDGHTKHGCVAFADELFDENGVYELSQLGDTRFYGTMLFDPDDLDDGTAERVRKVDYHTEIGDGDDA